MSIKYKACILCIVVVGLALATFFWSNEKEASPLNPGSPMGMGMPDDPNSRINYEIARLADPATGEIPQGIRKRELEFARTLPQRMERGGGIAWNHIGPVNKGGRTRAIALDVLNENIILAGGVTGGVWRSTDGGQNFVKVTDPGHIHSVTSIVQDTRPGHESTWYYGTGEDYGVVSASSFSALFSGDGIWKSTDNGQTWAQLASTASGTPQTMQTNGDFDFVWSIVTDHTNTVDDVVLAAVYNGIYRSTDGGQTWTPVLGLAAGNESRYVDVIQSPSGIFYASVSSSSAAKGYYRSTDGITWVNISPSLPSILNRTVMAVSPSNENQVYWLAHTPNTGLNSHSLWRYTYVSGDGSGAGGVWEERTNNLPNGTCTGYFTFDFGYYNSQSSYDMCIAVHPTDTNTVFIGGTSLYRSTDAFTTNTNTEWFGGYKCDTVDPSNYVYPNHHPDNHKMIFSPSSPNTMYSVHDGGISRTSDVMDTPVAWEFLNNGYMTTQYYTVAMEQGNVSNDVIIGGMQDNGTWYTNDNHIDSSWVEVGIDDGAYCAIATNQDFYIISSQAGRMYKKDVDANGNVLGTQRIDPTGGPNNYNFINPFILDPNNTDIMYLNGRTRIWRNDDLSQITLTGDIYNTISTNWNNLTASNVPLPGGYITTLDMSAAWPNVLYYGTSNGWLYRLDDANTASPVQTRIQGTGFPIGYMSCIAPNPYDGDEWIATFSNYGIKSIFYSSDGGNTWESISGNLEEFADGSGSGPAVYWAAIYPGFPKTYFVATSTGLYATNTLAGDNTVWTQESPGGIGNVVINMIKTRPYDGRVVVGTHGNGVYTADLPPAWVGVEEQGALLGAVKSYPNPFIDQMVFEFSLEQDARVQLEVFDLQGKLINTLLNERKSTGTYQVSWDRTNSKGQRVKSGTYLYQLTINDTKASGKLVAQ